MIAKILAIGLAVGLIFGSIFVIFDYKDNQYRAENSYMIQQDAREFWKDYNRDAVIKWLNDDLNSEYGLDAFFWEAFNLQSSIRRMVENKAVTEDFAEAWKQDFCGFLKHDKVYAKYKEMKESGQVDPKLEEVCTKVDYDKR